MLFRLRREYDPRGLSTRNLLSRLDYRFDVWGAPIELSRHVTERPLRLEATHRQNLHDDFPSPRRLIASIEQL